MDEGDVIVRADHVAQSREPLLDALDDDLLRQAVAQVLNLLVGRRVGDEQPADVPDGRSTDVPAAPDGRVDHGDVLDELRFQDGVEVLRSADPGEGVRVREGGKDPDLGGVLEGATRRHGVRPSARVRGCMRGCMRELFSIDECSSLAAAAVAVAIWVV
mmetsp:Transcript_26071/g.61231  ORF Transcript_26071/g.61231 Transcript_26071/m.61231 type:complete len:159 (-) Transcript_26071:300-776(-)